MSRSSLSYKQKSPKEAYQEIVAAIEAIYLERPSLGYRKITVLLKTNYQLIVNKKKVQRIMKKLGLKGIVSKRKLSVNHSKQYRYPYLLKKAELKKANDAWAVDITYIKLPTGYIYVTCIIDIVSRYVVGCYVSTTLDAKSSLKALDQALLSGLKPAILNSDQGVQFTSSEWIKALESHSICISMDGKGRYADNIYIERFWKTLKYEEVFLRSYETVPEARKNISAFIEWYNNRRPHQSLGYKTPKCIYFQPIDDSFTMPHTISIHKGPKHSLNF